MLQNARKKGNDRLDEQSSSEWAEKYLFIQHACVQGSLLGNTLGKGVLNHALPVLTVLIISGRYNAGRNANDSLSLAD